MTKSSVCGKENFALRGIPIPFDVRLGVAELCASLYIYFSFSLSLFLSLCRATPWIPCRILRWLRLGGNSRAPIADSMKVRITCASAPIRLRSWNNRLQRALRPPCSLRWNFCWRYVTGLMKKSVRLGTSNFSTYPRHSTSYIYGCCSSDVRTSWSSCT